MAVMKEESFGPLACIMPVKGDEDAVRLMNDSRYGQTASIWTQDLDAATALGERSEEHTSELQSQFHLVCRLLLEKKKKKKRINSNKIVKDITYEHSYKNFVQHKLR